MSILNLFCCSGKKTNKKKEFQPYKIFDFFKGSIDEEKPGKLLAQGNCLLDNNNMSFCLFENIFTLNSSLTSKQQGKHLINLKHDYISFTPLYDKNYRERDKKSTGIKFVFYPEPQSTDSNLNGNKESESQRNSKTETVKSRTTSDKEKEKHEINLLWEDQSSLNMVLGHLEKLMTQTEFRWAFKTIEILGEGSSGTVFNVMNRNSLQQYAAKVVDKKELRAEKHSYAAIKQEIELMMAINSQYTIKLHCVFQDVSNIYLILDLFSGGTLQQKIDKHKKGFKISDIQTIMIQLFKAVIDIHKNDIMHRDIKPDNILFKSSENLDLVLCDFGLSTRVHADEYLYQNVGTPGYVAPEVYYSKKQYSAICDVYSCGVVMYQLLYNKLPFIGETVEEILEQNKHSIIDFNSLPQRTTGEETTVKFLKKMLQKNPEDRITAEECLKDSYFLLKEDDLILSPITMSKSYMTAILAEEQKLEALKKKVKDKVREEIQDKYDFTLPRTPLMGAKVPLSIQHKDVEMRTRFDSLTESVKSMATSPYGTPQGHNQLTPLQLNANNNGSPGQVCCNELLKQTLLKNNMGEGGENSPKIEGKSPKSDSQESMFKQKKYSMSPQYQNQGSHSNEQQKRSLFSQTPEIKSNNVKPTQFQQIPKCQLQEENISPFFNQSQSTKQVDQRLNRYL